MIVNRRTALKNFVFIAGGIAFLPSCLQEDGKASLPLKSLKINSPDEKLLAEIAGTLIPATDTPGAKEMNAHLFILKMVDDCTPKEDQKTFMAGLDEFEKLCKNKYNQSFANCTPPQREEFLNTVEKKEVEGNVADFYKKVKSLTIEAYLNSQYVMTKLIPFELVPARWHGCIPVKQPLKKPV